MHWKHWYEYYALKYRCEFYALKTLIIILRTEDTDKNITHWKHWSEYYALKTLKRILNTDNNNMHWKHSCE